MKKIKSFKRLSHLPNKHLLARIGGDHLIQGYFFSKPVTEDEAIKMLEERLVQET
ncbi:MAG: hypothetical protein ACOYVD_11490 [Bacillota bacterium]